MEEREKLKGKGDEIKLLDFRFEKTSVRIQERKVELLVVRYGSGKQVQHP